MPDRSSRQGPPEEWNHGSHAARGPFPAPTAADGLGNGTPGSHRARTSDGPGTGPNDALGADSYDPLGADSYGGGQGDPFANRAGSFGVSDPLGSRADTFGSRADTFGSRADTFGSGADAFGAGAGASDGFGARVDAYGAGQAEGFGARADSFGAGQVGAGRANAFGAGQAGAGQVDAFGTGQVGAGQANAFGTGQVGAGQVDAFGVRSADSFGTAQADPFGDAAPFGARTAEPFGPSGTATFAAVPADAGTARPDAGRAASARARQADSETSDTRGFLGALFDFGFTSFVTPKVIKVLYMLIVIGTVVSALVVTIVAFKASTVFGILMLVFGDPLFILIVLAIYRIILEFFVVTFRVAEDIRALRERGDAG